MTSTWLLVFHRRKTLAVVKNRLEVKLSNLGPPVPVGLFSCLVTQCIYRTSLEFFSRSFQNISRNFPFVTFEVVCLFRSSVVFPYDFISDTVLLTMSSNTFKSFT